MENALWEFSVGQIRNNQFFVVWCDSTVRNEGIIHFDLAFSRRCHASCSGLVKIGPKPAKFSAMTVAIRLANNTTKYLLVIVGIQDES